MAKFQVVFDSDVCKGCELCRASCPKGIIEMSGEINSKGYSPAAVTRADACIGCSSCALVCPDGAIEIFRVAQIGDSGPSARIDNIGESGRAGFNEEASK